MRERKISPIIVLERAMKDSPAFRGLCGTAIVVLLDFLGKRVIRKRRVGSKREEIAEVVNNSQITYSYAEAEKKGISHSAFQHTLDQLIERGFIDVATTGAGVFKAATLYAISDRWRSWGTDEFVSRSRPRKARWAKHVGFQKGHPHYTRKETPAQ